MSDFTREKITCLPWLCCFCSCVACLFYAPCARAQAALSEPLELLGKSQVLLGSKQYAQAIPLLERAARLAPKHDGIARAQCHALTEVGSTQAAIDACRRAVANEATQKDWPSDMLAMVRALLSAKTAPTTEHLFQAISIASSLMRKVPNQPWPYLAQCEIASRLQLSNADRYCDARFTEWASANLKYNYAQRLAQVKRARWGVWSVWLVLFACFAGTLLHWLSAKLKKGQLASLRGTIRAAILLLSVLPNSATAQVQQQPKPGDIGTVAINEKDPSASVPSAAQRDRDPLGYAYFVMDVTARGEKAMKHEDYATAVLYYKALAKAVPNKSVGYTKLCTAYAAEQDWANAIENCRTALGYDGVKDGDYANYSHLLMEHTPKLAVSQVQQLDAIVQHLRSAQPPSVAADFVECEVGVKLHDKARLQRCTANLSTSNPADLRTLSFQWAYAVERGDYDAASSLVRQMQQTDISPATLRRMEEATALALPSWKRAVKTPMALVVLLGIVAAIAAVFVALRYLRQPATVK